MTARFGRNKRRAAREAVAQANAELEEAKAAAERASALADHLYQRAYNAERLLGEVKERLIRAVGAESALLPLDLQPKRKRPREAWARRHPIKRDLDGFMAMSAVPGPLSLDMAGDVVDLFRLVTIIERHPYDFSKLVRFQDSGEDHRRGFSRRATWISAHALRDIGIMGSDYLSLVETIARDLIEHPPQEHRG
ncbi:hypothetical protein SAMN05216456_1339 [Devosia crocina]|uniref:Uncharacterized protein n=1 Tax=Devosia crocina TaxID=429728 RepID=A0A1I7N9S2_9HYPH|nr:hypothetical protein [Devosia crocina]SFV31432.1 hypothetical protein SAMN05216456_1339 [Devosia crocina]